MFQPGDPDALVVLQPSTWLPPNANGDPSFGLHAAKCIPAGSPITPYSGQTRFVKWPGGPFQAAEVTHFFFMERYGSDVRVIDGFRQPKAGFGLAQFAKEAGIKFKVVPFGSGAQMVQALMAGKIDATLPNVSEAANQVADGSFRALAVMAEERLKDYPNVPSTFEKGIKAKCSTTRGYAVLASAWLC